VTGKIKVPGSGIEMAVRVEGEGEDVLFLHGFPDSSRLWRHQIDALVANGYRAIAPDLRGFGDTDRPEGVEQYSMMYVLGDIMSLLDHLDSERAHIVGHDWGAATAWVVASLAPERTRSLTVLSVGHPGMLREASYEQLTRSWYMFMFQFEGIAEDWLTRNDYEFVRTWVQDNPDLEHYIEDMSQPGALTAALNWYRASLRPDAWITDPPPLPPIAAPTMGVWSSNDIALLEPQMVGSQKFVEGPWRYERIDGVDHWIPTQAPEKLNELLLDFLSSVSR
jgi:pimeloyl-ACP methyl ester carboxylesterase